MSAEYNPSGIPAELKSLKMWALSTEGQVNRFGAQFSPKAPLIPIHGEEYCRGVKPTAPDSWCTFDEVDAWQDLLGGYPGLMVSNGYVGIDWDLEKAPNEYAQWVRDVALSYAPQTAHVEWSSSGKGVRVILKGTIPKSRKAKVLEMYGQDRFLRMTGNTIAVRSSTPLDEQQWIDWLYSSMPQQAGFAEVEVGGVEFIHEMPSPEICNAVYERIIADMDANPNVWAGDRAAIEHADRGDITGSDAGWQATMAFAKYKAADGEQLDAATVLVCILALEGIQNHYGAKDGPKAAAEIKRKFENDWWPKAMAQAPAKIAADQLAIERAKSLEMQHLAAAQSDGQAAYAQAVKSAKQAQTFKTIDNWRDLKPFPVEVLNDFFYAMVDCVVETELELAVGVCVSDAAAMCARVVKTKNNLMTHLYSVMIADQGVGKNIDKSFPKVLKYCDISPHEAARYTMPRPASGQALGSNVASRPFSRLVVSDAGPTLEMWVNGNENQRAVLSEFRDLFTMSADDIYVGRSHSDSKKDVADTIAPSISFMIEGTPEQIFTGFRDMGEEDGMTGRFKYIVNGFNKILNQEEFDQEDKPPVVSLALKRAVNTLHNMRGLNGSCHTRFVPYSPRAAHYMTRIMRAVNKLKTDVADDRRWVWRSFSINVQRIALTLATWEWAAREDCKNVTPQIEVAHLLWAFRHMRGSVAAVRHLIDGKAMYDSQAEQDKIAILRLIEAYFAKSADAISHPEYRPMREQNVFTKAALINPRKPVGFRRRKSGDLDFDRAFLALLEEDYIAPLSKVYGQSVRGVRFRVTAKFTDWQGRNAL